MAIELEIPIIVPGNGLDLAEDRASATGEAVELHVQSIIEDVRQRNAEKGANGVLLNVFSPACFWYGGRAVYNGISAVFAQATARATLQRAGDGHLVDIKDAECSKQADWDNIKAAIVGKEDRINRLVGKCIMQAAASTVRLTSQ